MEKWGCLLDVELQSCRMGRFWCSTATCVSLMLLNYIL